MKFMKILIILNEAPLPFSSAASRWYYSLLRGLEQVSDIEVSLIAACQNLELLNKSLELFPWGHFYLYPREGGLSKKIKTVLMPFSYNISQEMQSKVEELSCLHDVIHVEQTFASWACKNISKKHVLSIHYLSRIDLENSHPINFKDWLIVKMMMHTEKRLIKKFHHIKTCSLRIADYIKSQDEKNVLSSFPFAIDIERYSFLESSSRVKTNTVTLIANMGWYPGKSAAMNLLEKIWPILKSNNSKLKLRIVGWNARVVLKDFLNSPDVEILENVPNIEEFFYNADVIIYYPEKGSGIKIKIQEAMLYGIPVATNSEGAEGLNLEDGYHCILEDNLSTFIQKTDKLIRSNELQEKLRNNARDLIVNCCSINEVLKKQTELYKEIIRINSNE